MPAGPVQEISAMETEGIGTFHNHSQEDYKGFLEGSYSIHPAKIIQLVVCSKFT